MGKLPVLYPLEATPPQTRMFSMVLFDKPLAELRTYQAPDTEPADLDAFWARTLHETLRIHSTPVSNR